MFFAYCIIYSFALTIIESNVNLFQVFGTPGLIISKILPAGKTFNTAINF